MVDSLLDGTMENKDIGVLKVSSCPRKAKRLFASCFVVSVFMLRV